jgi:sugar O-acyltransferase (sialic acid O-acetyltransferase NeuD family)
MLIIGAKGFAKEILEILIRKTYNEDALCFFDDIDTDLHFVYNKFKILHSKKEVQDWFKQTNNKYVLGIGNPKIREILNKKFIAWGGNPYTLISSYSTIGSFETVIGKGTVICDGVRITNSIKIGENCLINLNATIGHDCIIGENVEICPNTSISGNCMIGENTFIGTGATINPNIRVGKNVVVGSGSVVIKDVPDYTTVVGVPAK